MCLFCDIVEGKISSKRVYEDDKCIAILDISQATYGHTLVMPKQHFDNFLVCDPCLLAHLTKTAQKLANKIVENCQADGCNIVVNTNEAAGQSVMHLHIHIIPRYKDDDYKIIGTTHQYDLDEVLEKINRK